MSASSPRQGLIQSETARLIGNHLAPHPRRIATEPGVLRVGADANVRLPDLAVTCSPIDLADRLCVTHVEIALEGDTSFPAIDPALWRATETIDVPAGDKDSYPTKFVVYDRR